MTFKRQGLVAVTEGRSLLYWCQGCGHAHVIRYGEGPSPRWSWNGNGQKPTFEPSIREFVPEHEHEDGTVNPERTTCHHFVRDGEIEFLDDCSSHALRGKHPLQPIPANYGGVDD